jgi:hypothetical protein
MSGDMEGVYVHPLLEEFWYIIIVKIGGYHGIQRDDGFFGIDSGDDEVKEIQVLFVEILLS